MRMIVKVFDVFEGPNRSTIIGCINHELDNLSAAQIRDLIGEKVEVHNPSGSVVRSPVVDIDIGNSIIDHKNVFILLPSDIKKEAIEIGANVYSC